MLVQNQMTSWIVLVSVSHDPSSRREQFLRDVGLCYSQLLSLPGDPRHITARIKGPQTTVKAVTLPPHHRFMRRVNLTFSSLNTYLQMVLRPVF